MTRWIGDIAPRGAAGRDPRGDVADGVVGCAQRRLALRADRRQPSGGIVAQRVGRQVGIANLGGMRAVLVGEVQREARRRGLGDAAALRVVGGAIGRAQRIGDRGELADVRVVVVVEAERRLVGVGDLLDLPIVIIKVAPFAPQGIGLGEGKARGAT